MADPASGPVAAGAAVAVSTAPMIALSHTMPADASVIEFILGCGFAMIGAAAYQFICAQAARQAAADKNVPVADRPKIDTVMLGYSMLGSPMAVACLIYSIHKFGGNTGFGDATWAASVAGYMIAGAAGPTLVFKIVGAFTSFIGSKTGGK